MKEKNSIHDAWTVWQRTTFQEEGHDLPTTCPDVLHWRRKIHCDDLHSPTLVHFKNAPTWFYNCSYLPCHIDHINQNFHVLKYYNHHTTNFAITPLEMVTPPIQWRRPPAKDKGYCVARPLAKCPPLTTACSGFCRLLKNASWKFNLTRREQTLLEFTVVVWSVFWHHFRQSSFEKAIEFRTEQNMSWISVSGINIKTYAVTVVAASKTILDPHWIQIV